MVVRKSYNRTVNLGNYENIKIGIELSQECEVKDIDKVAEFLKLKAQEIIMQEVDEVKNGKSS